MGGVAHVCYNTLKYALQNPSIKPHAFYDEGSTNHFDLPIPLTHIENHSVSQKQTTQVAHSLCHRQFNVEADIHIFTVHDVWAFKPNRYQTDSYNKQITDIMIAEIQQADHVVTISNTTHENLLEFNLIPKNKCTCIPLGVEPLLKQDTYFNENLNSILPLDYILFVGRFEARKNLEHVLEAVIPLKDIHLVLAGSPGFGYEKIKKHFEKFPQDRIHILQHVERSDLAYLYESAIATLYPTWEEGFGLPILEAMVHGCPLITSNRSANAEIGGTGTIFINPESASESTDAILRLQDDFEFRNQKIADGYKQAKKYSWVTYIESLSKLYTSLL